MKKGTKEKVDPFMNDLHRDRNLSSNKLQGSTESKNKTRSSNHHWPPGDGTAGSSNHHWPPGDCNTMEEKATTSSMGGGALIPAILIKTAQPLLSPGIEAGSPESKNGTGASKALPCGKP